MKTTLVLDAGSGTTTLLLALPDSEPSEWPKTIVPAGHPVRDAATFLCDGGFPQPELALVCGMGIHPAASPADALRMRRWKAELHGSGLCPEFVLRNTLPGWEVQALLEKTASVFPLTLAADSAAAAFMAGLSLRTVRERCQQEGVTLIYAGHSHVQVFMVYRERLLGLYEQHSSVALETFHRHVEEMRLNWLPDEEVRASGGHGCICGELPAEAEGFRPTFVFGPDSTRFAECGRLVKTCQDEAFARCFGLLEALKRRDAA